MTLLHTENANILAISGHLVQCEQQYVRMFIPFLEVQRKPFS